MVVAVEKRAGRDWWWKLWRGIKPLHYRISLSLSHSHTLSLSPTNGSPDQELQMISWQFFTLFKPVMFYRLICYDTLLRIQLWIRDVSWGWKPTSRWAWPMTWKAIGDASACSMCCTDKAAGHRQKPSHTNFADHSVFTRWVSTGTDFPPRSFSPNTRFMDFPSRVCGFGWRKAKKKKTFAHKGNSVVVDLR